MNSVTTSGPGFAMVLGAASIAGARRPNNVLPNTQAGSIRDEQMWNWNRQFLKRPFGLKLDSGRLAAYMPLMPEGWTPADGTILPIGEVHHLAFARRQNKGQGALGHGGRVVPFCCPLVSMTAHVAAPGGPQPIAIGGHGAGLRSQYDLAHKPCRKGGGGLVLPRSSSRLLQAALDMEQRMVDAHVGRERLPSVPDLPVYYAVFPKGRPVESDNRFVIDVVMEMLRGGPKSFLTENLSSPGGVVEDVVEDEGWKIVRFRVAAGEGTKTVDRVLPGSAVLETYVAAGAELQQGTRLGYYCTPRDYPSWKAVRAQVLGEDAADAVMVDVVDTFDIRHNDHVFRDVRFCPRGVAAREYTTIYEDVRGLVAEDGTPRVQVVTYHALFTEFAQNGASFKANTWSHAQTPSHLPPA